MDNALVNLVLCLSGSHEPDDDEDVDVNSVSDIQCTILVLLNRAALQIKLS